MKMQKSAVVCLCISLAIMLVALVMSLCGMGINFGLDFAGGLNLTYNMNQTFSQDDVKAILTEQGLKEFSVSTVGADGTTLQIRLPQLGDDEIQTVKTSLGDALRAKYPGVDTTNTNDSYVGPVAGATLIKNAIFSVLLASALMLVYIAFRFDLYSGIAAVIGLLHDVLIMLSAMVLLRNVVQMNSSFIAAMLTIVGYSINNTIVIFDRIRENNKKAEYSSLSRNEVVRLSIKESLGRTINTTLTTLVTIVALYVLGVDAIREFCLPIIVGILAGAFSANLINGYVWAALEEKRLSAGAKAKAKKA